MCFPVHEHSSLDSVLSCCLPAAASGPEHASLDMAQGSQVYVLSIHVCPHWPECLSSSPANVNSTSNPGESFSLDHPSQSSISRLPAPQEQPSEAWQRHCYLPYGQPGQVQNQILQYGQPSTLDEFADLAQVANYVQYR